MLLLAGTVTEGRRYTAPAGPGWRFTLDPGEFGWTIRLIARNGDDLAQVTPPFHFVNPRYLDGGISATVPTPVRIRVTSTRRRRSATSSSIARSIRS